MSLDRRGFLVRTGLTLAGGAVGGAVMGGVLYLVLKPVFARIVARQADAAPDPELKIYLMKLALSWTQAAGETVERELRPNPAADHHRIGRPPERPRALPVWAETASSNSEMLVAPVARMSRWPSTFSRPRTILWSSSRRCLGKGDRRTMRHASTRRC